MSQVFEWIDVKDALPERSGKYFCIRYGMDHSPDLIIFNNGFNEYCENDPPRWEDWIPGGGGLYTNGVKNSPELQHWKDNYGKVLKWFPSPERPDDE